MRIAVAGAGVVGLATAWALRKRGHDVTVFDRGPIPNPMASSYDEQRYHRFAYGKMAGYSKLALGVTQAWDEVWKSLRHSLYVETGVIYVGTLDSEDLELSVEFARESGMAFEELSAREIARRYPHLSLRSGNRAALFPQSGILLASRILNALANWLAEEGVALRPYAKVEDVEHENGRLRVLGAWHQFDQIVIAAGPWTGELVPEGRTLEPSRQIMLYAQPPDRLAEGWVKSPAFADLTVEGNFYVTPPLRGTQMKMTFDVPFEGSDPNTSREASPAEIVAVSQIARSTFDHFDDYRIIGGRACYYTNTRDRTFFVRGLGKSWGISTCSGHGFKFGALTAISIADAVEGKISATELRNRLAARVGA